MTAPGLADLAGAVGFLAQVTTMRTSRLPSRNNALDAASPIEERRSRRRVSVEERRSRRRVSVEERRSRRRVSVEERRSRRRVSTDGTRVSTSVKHDSRDRRWRGLQSTGPSRRARLCGSDREPTRR
jgi:hypothetical protein